MKLFFSCDWGTSAFRLRLIDAKDLKVLSAIVTDHGIATAFECWKQKSVQEENRIGFYKNYLLEQVKKITHSFNNDLYDAPIVISGMASSNIGMIELIYKELPFKCNGTDLVIHTIPPGTNDAYQMIVISGVKSEVDVMRGEETMLVGCNIIGDEKEQIFIFPGTHSKHITVKNGLVTNISTYLTGELFDLLSAKSILSAAVKKNGLAQNTGSHFFIDGVGKGCGSNLLNSLFQVRTNQLFKKATPEENYHYLSGLLIGHELKDLAENKPDIITLVCSEGLKASYMQALSVIGLDYNLKYKNADDALINGQRIIMQQHRQIKKTAFEDIN